MSQNEEKLAQDAVLNFLGNTYGELKKLDGNVIGPSSTLGSRSVVVKNELEKFIIENKNKPVHINPSQPSYPENNTPEVQQPQVQVNQPVEPIQMPVDNNQLTFDFDVNEKEELFSLVEKILTRLDKLHRKVDELTLVHSDFVKTYQQSQEIISKKKSPTKKTIKKREEN